MIVATFTLEEVIPFVFTSDKRYALRKAGYKYTDLKWINASKRIYPITTVYKEHNYKILNHVTVAMGAHRYQLFATKGTDCVQCGLKGTFFALECDKYNALKPNKHTKFHFNLYGVDEYGNKVMITKDHIIPRFKGGKNILSNYQTLCCRCNRYKADYVKS